MNPSTLMSFETWGLRLRRPKSIIMIINTDDMLISYSDNVRELVDFFEKKLNNIFR